MKKTIKYTICSFLPNPSESAETFDFGIIVASKNDLSAMGVNLSAYGLRSSHPLQENIFTATLDIVKDRIDEACRRADSRTGFDVLNAIINSNMSSFWYSEIKTIQTIRETQNEANRLFRLHIVPRVLASRPKARRRLSDRWSESSLDHKEEYFELAGCP